MERKSQTNDIIKYLQTHKRGITSLEAINMFGATRLSGIMFALRKRGYNIGTEMKDVPNRYGGVSRVAVYKLMD